MDYLRSGYLGTFRIGPGDETITVRWYKAAPTAKEFPTAHAFASLVWEGDYPHGWLGAQELPTSPRIWRPTNLPFTPAGDHFEGPLEWFEDGIPANWRELAPPVGENCFPNRCLLQEDLNPILLEDGSGCIELEP